MTCSLLLAAAQAMTFTADRIAADNVTYALTATGNVVATYAPLTVRGELMTRDADGKILFHDPVCVTTCSNEVGHTHWNVTGEVEYQDKSYVIVRNAWLNFCEVPVMWLPYMYYPLDISECGFSWMAGYTGRWGAYALSKYSYHIIGDEDREDNTWWLDGATRFDLRYKQGVALGEDLDWNLGDFGNGKLNFYYAWDQDVGTGGRYGREWYNYNWGSDVDKDRYAVELEHNWEVTERDSVRVKANVYSDSYFRRDFYRTSLFNSKSQWLGYDTSGVFWEHVEDMFAIGGEVSGPLNDFYGMTGRLPEFYIDVNPQPILGLPLNYESESRVGYLTRDYAKYGDGNPENPFAFNPGQWAEYESFRLDTYHRITAPFKTLDDVLSVVPRIGYHGTYWSKGGYDNLDGWGRTGDAGNMARNILEGGVTFAGRGTGWINDRWRHMIEPYADVLAQKAWYSGMGDGERPYVFDTIDASVMWEDQFAGRSRNLPYTYYGVTPGVRNAWERLDERGKLRQVLDFDIYAALQFGESSYVGDSSAHRLAEVGDPNYGRQDCYVSPGFRIRWTPADDIMLLARAEYDPDNDRVATADVGWQQRVTENFRYNVTYALRDYRWWDYSSTPYDPEQMESDDLNYAKYHYVHVGWEHQPIDWFAWGPYLRWDIRESEVDSVGTWFDFMTDCLGFRFIVEYDNSFKRIDGFEYGDDWSVGFYVYLRAFGADRANIFMR